MEVVYHPLTHSCAKEECHIDKHAKLQHLGRLEAPQWPQREPAARPQATLSNRRDMQHITKDKQQCTQHEAAR